MKYFIFFIFCLFSSVFCFSNTWYVGASRTYTLPSQVQSLVADGDTIYIDGGTYNNDAVKWSRKNLSIIGLDTGSNRTVLKYTGDIPNGKGIFVFETPGNCDNAYIENIVFDGAQVSNANGANGAGIRYQANNLTINNCKFINCQNGILEGHGSVTTSNVTIIGSEFENNGYQLQNDPNYSGYAHHIYISASTDTLVVENCYFHHPRGQANCLKTRAQRSFILYNMIDEATGYGSWEINIAQGGLNVIMGNIIIQGPSGSNHGIVGYDAATNSLEDFYFVNNTVLNKYAGNIKYFNVAPSSGINTFKVYNNIFASVSGAFNTFMTGNVPATMDTSHNIIASNYLSIGFTDPAANDYSLAATSTAAIDNGIDAGFTTTSYQLMPDYMYQSFNGSLLPRNIMNGTIDIGAYEFGTVLPVSFIKLSAIIRNNDVVIHWNTSGEMKADHFEIERSTNGADFSIIKTIKVISSNTAFDYIDYDAASRTNGNAVYYRIKMINNGGKSFYSNIAPVKSEKTELDFSLYPNPFTDKVILTVESDRVSKATVIITDAEGRMVRQYEIDLRKGVNHVTVDQSGKLSKGIYKFSLMRDNTKISKMGLKE